MARFTVEMTASRYLGRPEEDVAPEAKHARVRRDSAKTLDPQSVHWAIIAAVSCLPLVPPFLSIRRLMHLLAADRVCARDALGTVCNYIYPVGSIPTTTKRSTIIVPTTTRRTTTSDEPTFVSNSRDSETPTPTFTTPTFTTPTTPTFTTPSFFTTAQPVSIPTGSPIALSGVNRGAIVDRMIAGLALSVLIGLL